MDEEARRKRAVAVKLGISHIRALPYVKDEQGLSYLRYGTEQISRVNVVGIVVQKAPDGLSLSIDDGSGNISLRVFEDNGILSKREAGDHVLVIGKPREYGSERYLLPEIVSRVGAEWFKVRKKELDCVQLSPSGESSPMKGSMPLSYAEGSDPGVEEVESGKSPADLICAFIKENDQGDGVDIQRIVESSTVENAEPLVMQLIRNGDIFEIRPGRVKVME